MRSLVHFQSISTILLYIRHCSSLALAGFLEVFQIDQARSHSNLPDRHRRLGGLLGNWPAFLLSAVIQHSDGLV
jgi:hypothetical protein